MRSIKNAKTRYWIGILTIAIVFSVGASAVFAAGPAINPTSVEELIFPGESVDIVKTVTTSGIIPKPDIYFFADNTGSMENVIPNVQANAAAVLTSIMGSTNDPRFGAGYYRDFNRDPAAFVNQAPIPATDDGGAAALAAIAAWSASGGYDQAEGQFYGLDQLASGVANWRTDSTKIIVWFGDAAGHDPICSGISGLPYDITEASLTAKLVAADIRVIAIGVVDVNSFIPGGLNGDPTNWSQTYVGLCPTIDGSAGQPERIAAATGGVYLSDVPPDQIDEAILEGLGALEVQVSMTSGCMDPISTSFAPASQTVTSGSDAVFTETISVAAGAAGGTYTCKDWALVDGQPMTDMSGNIIYEEKTIHVPTIELSPPTAINELMPDATHTVTALVTADSYGPVSGVPIQFEVISGPNMGMTGSGVTDANGEAPFTYGPGSTVSPADLGTDTIQASFTNMDGTVVYGSATATKEWVDTTPPVAACVEGVNPSGKHIPAAPGKGGQGQNQDGFYELYAVDMVWPSSDIMMYVTDTGSGVVFGPFPVGTYIKYTQAPGGKPSIQPMAGAVSWHIHGKGDASFSAVDGSGNMSDGVMCLVPPPPK
jgi:hypothetical protein